MVHPDVLEAYEQAIRVLRKARIPYRETGGIALNFYGAGRPTKDVDLIVRRTDWLRAIRALGRIATDQPGIRFGLPDERLARVRAELTEACTRVGRDPATLDITVGITVRYEGAPADAISESWRRESPGRWPGSLRSTSQPTRS